MKLVVHAGLHKAASTSFQNLCAANRAALAERGVLYPKIDHGVSHHNSIAELLALGKTVELSQTLQTLAPSDGDNISQVLLSAEDFENCLGDLEMANRFEAAAMRAGFSEIVWCFVLRDQWTYFNSLYAELNKHNVSHSYEAMMMQIIKHGNFVCTTRTYRKYYEFDYGVSLDRFADRITGNVIAFEFAAFCKDGIGRPLLETMLEKGDISDLYGRTEPLGNAGQSNKRRNRFAVEYRYLCNFLSSDPARLKWLKSLILSPLIIHRMQQNASAENRFKGEFKQRFHPQAIAIASQEHSLAKN